MKNIFKPLTNAKFWFAVLILSFLVLVVTTYYLLNAAFGGGPDTGSDVALLLLRVSFSSVAIAIIALICIGIYRVKTQPTDRHKEMADFVKGPAKGERLDRIWLDRIWVESTWGAISGAIISTALFLGISFSGPILDAVVNRDAVLYTQSFLYAIVGATTGMIVGWLGQRIASNSLGERAKRAGEIIGGVIGGIAAWLLLPSFILG